MLNSEGSRSEKLVDPAQEIDVSEQVQGSSQMLGPLARVRVRHLAWWPHSPGEGTERGWPGLRVTVSVLCLPPGRGTCQPGSDRQVSLIVPGFHL